MLKVIGAIIFVAGAFLWLGNVFHFFPTIPFAGYLTMLAGGAVFRSGNGS